MGTGATRPLIGITCGSLSLPDWSDNSPTLPVDYVFRNYQRAVHLSGGIPVLIPVLEQTDIVACLLDRINGLVLSGGGDLSPRFFDQEPLPGLKSINPERDRLELELAVLAAEKDLPVLGICRGLQVMNVALGGTLYQDIVTQVPGCLNHGPKAPKHTATHKIQVSGDSRLHGLLGAATVWVNSGHHQAVFEPGRGFVLTATAADGIVEALERPDLTFFLGVQWHPEGLFPVDEGSRKLFTGLIDAARTGPAPKAHPPGSVKK